MAKMIDVEITGRSKYDFNAWSNNKVWELTSPNDFQNAKSLIASAYNFCRKNNFKLKHKILKDGKVVHIQFIKTAATAKTSPKKKTSK
jgi:hypothetical protein